jgi:hypothetical protein
MSSGGAVAVIEYSFPIKSRFDKAAKYHLDKHKIQPLSGQFWNLCVNMAFPNPDDPSEVFLDLFSFSFHSCNS